MNDNTQNIQELEADQLQPNPLQPRGIISPESLVELVDSIREHGILEPILVAETPAGYQIVAGERRWRAAKIAGLKKVPVTVRKTTAQGMLEMSIVENVQREDLNPIERAQAYQRLMDEFGLVNSDIAQRVGKSPAYISNSLRLLTLPDALKDGLVSGAATEGHVRALAALEDPKLIVEAYKIILRDGLSVRGAEELSRRMKAGAGRITTGGGEQTIVISEELDKIRDEIAHALNAKVKLLRSQRETKVQIVLKGSLEQTEERLQKLYKALTL
jgi:ParB family transcriptional regulator, chromosome partitioning protein